MGLRLKILSGFLILTLMLLIAGVWSIYEFTKVGMSVQGLLDDNYKSIDAAKMMTDALERQDSGILLLLLGKWEQGRSIVEPADAQFEQGFKIAQSNVTIAGEKAYVDAVESKYRIYRDLLIKPIVGTQHEGNLDWYFKSVHQAFLDVKLAVKRLMDLNDQAMYRTASELKSRAYRAIMPGVVAILSALIFTLIFNFFINYYVVSPIIKITAGIRQFIEQGEPLDVKIETNDELSRLLSSIQQLVAQTRANERAK